MFEKLFKSKQKKPGKPVDEEESDLPEAPQVEGTLSKIDDLLDQDSGDQEPESDRGYRGCSCW